MLVKVHVLSRFNCCSAVTTDVTVNSHLNLRLSVRLRRVPTTDLDGISFSQHLIFLPYKVKYELFKYSPTLENDNIHSLRPYVSKKEIYLHKLSKKKKNKCHIEQ